MKKLLLTSITVLGFFATSHAQNVGVGTSTPHPSAKLDISATNAGVLFPNVTLISATDATTIVSPAKGLVIWNTGTSWGNEALYVNTGTSISPTWDVVTTGAGTVTTVGGTAPIVSSGGTTPIISITGATGSAAGSMSATDKAKLDTITGNNTGDQTITLTGDVTGSGTGTFAATISNDAVTTVKILNSNVTSAKIANNAVDNTKTADMATQTFKGRNAAGTGDPEDLNITTARTMLGISTAVNGTGTQNYVTKWNNAGGTTIGNSLIFDNGTNVGIGSNAPAQKLQIDEGNVLSRGTANFAAAGNQAFYYMGDVNHYIRATSGSGVTIGTFGAPDGIFLQQSTGNVGIGVSGPVRKLDVAGNQRIRQTGSISVDNNSQLEISNAGTGAAFLSFHRENAWGHILVWM